MYVLTNNQTVLKFPYTIDELKNENPNTSFPVNLTTEVLAQHGVFPVVSTTATFDELTQIAELTGCSFNSSRNRWETAWTVRTKTQEELDKDFDVFHGVAVKKTRERLDEFAQTRDYDSILSACSYVNSTVPKFQAEGQYAIAARDQTWSTLYQILADIESGNRPRVSLFSDIEGELPTLTWPAV